MKQFTESQDMPRVISTMRFYQIRSPGGPWMDVDAEDYKRLLDVKVFDNRILGVLEETIKG